VGFVTGGLHVLYLDGESLLQLPYVERRARLEDLGLEAASWRMSVS
jgi:ATP-dependent DNA ligase